MLQTSVDTVKPGGTGRPALVISARPAPLPPSRSFMWRLPSALPLPKKYTYLRDLRVEVLDVVAPRSALVRLDIEFRLRRLNAVSGDSVLNRDTNSVNWV